MRPQPFLHELVSVLAAPTAVLSGADGQLRSGGTQGVLCADRRLLSRLVVTLDGVEPVPVGHALRDGSGATFTAVARNLGDPGGEPTVRLRRERIAHPDGLTETITVHSTAHQDVDTRLTLSLGTDLAALYDIKSGTPTTPHPPVRDPDGTVRWPGASSGPDAGDAGDTAAGTVHWDVAADAATGTVHWDVAGQAVVEAANGGAGNTSDAAAGPATGGPRTAPVYPDVTARTDPPAEHWTLGPDGAELGWSVRVPPGGSWTMTLRVAGGHGGPFRPAARAPWSAATVRSAAGDLDRVVGRGLADLAGLAMADRVSATDVFLGAGSPWFFTLFGRDSLWAARMLLPLGTDLAAGTLRVLARHQGTRHDARTGEQPGKIIHEVRAEHGGIDLPPRYYGTIDATPLWIITLRDAWRWGMPAAEVTALLGALRAALGWLTGPADPDGDGFLEYLDTTGGGLANQGWKDSPAAISWPDGTRARPPIALCEAQAYAYQAAIAGAELLATLGTDADRDTSAGLRSHAAALRERFRSAFWVTDAAGTFPALALDGDKRPVPVASSNLGHLLGTGLLDAGEAALVAARIACDDLSGSYGLRTLSDRVVGANPLGYHTGSVWPHDTAIAVFGLAREGHGATAFRLADGLLSAAPHFDHRLPELFGGTARDEPVLAYPASCRPQAWAAAAPVMLLHAALGLAPDVPGGSLTVRPDPAFAAWFPLAVDNLRVAGHRLTVTVSADGAHRAATTAALRTT